MTAESNWFPDQEGGEELLDTSEEIFQYIYDKIATYPQEIAQELGHSLRTIQHHLRRMFMDQRIGKIRLPRHQVPQRILIRLPELQAQHIYGSAIRKLTWYCIYETGEELRERLPFTNYSVAQYNPELLQAFLHNEAV